ncbi:MAG TPA: MFS transporter, partial [Solirubrobacterales bacterium]
MRSLAGSGNGDAVSGSSLDGASARALLRERDYLFFWITRWTGTLGVQTQSVAMGWQVYDLSRRTLDVGHASFNVALIGLITFAPLFFLALPAGETADRYDRKRLVVIGYLCELVPAGALAAAGAFGFASVPLLLSMALLFGTSRAFLNPAMTAMAPMLVPRELLPRAIAWNS